MIHKNRGNRRWIDKRKRRHKYNLAKVLCDKIKGVLGKYDKGHIYDLNDKLSPSEHEYGYEDRLSTSDKKKIESCDEKMKDYEKGYDEMDAILEADIDSRFEEMGEFGETTISNWSCAVTNKNIENSLLDSDDGIAMDKKSHNIPIGNM